jgi:hypothetical protein
VIASNAVEDLPATDVDVNVLSRPTCSIMGTPGCSTQTYNQFVDTKMGGSSVDSRSWQMLSPPNAFYEAYFPNGVFLEFATSSDHGTVREMQAWLANVGADPLYSLLVIKYDFSVSPVLDLTGYLEQVTDVFLNIEKTHLPDLKLVTKEFTEYKENQVLDFKMSDGKKTIRGRVLFLYEYAFILNSECSSKDCDDITYYEFINSFQPPQKIFENDVKGNNINENNEKPPVSHIDLINA